MHLLGAGPEGGGQFLFRRLAAEFIGQPLGDVVHLAERLAHMDGQADRAAFVGDRARDGLPDPPDCIGGELVAAPPIVLVHGAHQADVPLLDQVQQGQAPTEVLLGHADDEPQVGQHELLDGRIVSRLDPFGQLDLLGRGE